MPAPTHFGHHIIPGDEFGLAFVDRFDAFLLRQSARRSSLEDF
jgi:hypothetical protein